MSWHASSTVICSRGRDHPHLKLELETLDQSQKVMIMNHRRFGPEGSIIDGMHHTMSELKIKRRSE